MIVLRLAPKMRRPFKCQSHVTHGAYRIDGENANYTSCMRDRARSLPHLSPA